MLDFLEHEIRAWRSSKYMVAKLRGYKPVLYQFYKTCSPGLGLVFVVAGLAGSVLGGVLLDKTKRFKLVTVFTYA